MDMGIKQQCDVKRGNNQMKRLRITVVLLGLIFMSFSANAEEAFSENTLDEFESEILLDENEEQDIIQNEELSIIDENLLDESLDYTLDKDNDFYSEITDIEDSKLLSAVRDEYEDNDTMIQWKLHTHMPQLSPLIQY